MGVTTEVWRSRIGSFLPIIRSLSNCERRNWPSRKLYRTYNRPPEPSITHHLSLNILLTLLSLTLALIVSRTHPFDHVKKLKFHQVMLDVLAVHFAVFHNHRTKRHSAGTWQECINITAAIRMVMFVLLLLCGDIESNPGPNEHQPMDTRPKKAHKIERMDTNEKMGLGSSTLERLWIEVCSRWDDVTTDDFKLTEADGTELVDDVYYQQLASKMPLQLISKTKGTRSRSKSYARVNARPLTDDVIHEIATNHINHDILKLGLAMGFTQKRISKYKAENATEPRAESRGTENMIISWRQRCNDADQVGAFCNVLRQAELNELADDLANDILTGPDGVEVVSPSMTGFNSNTKIELTMVSTTKCVIECNNLAEMPAEDLSRLTEFLEKIPHHPIPIAEVEAPTTRITGPSADKIYKVRTADNPKSISVSGSVTKGEQSMASSALSSADTSSMSQVEVGRSTNASTISIDRGSPLDPVEVGLRTEVAPTQPSKSPTSMTSTSPANMGDGNLRYMTSSSTQFDACFSDTTQISQASSEIVIYKFPIALISLSSSNKIKKLRHDLERQLPRQIFIVFKGIKPLATNWHSFATILLDLGEYIAGSSCSDECESVLDIYQTCLKKMRVPQNLALLVLAPANAHSAKKHADIMSMISEISKTTEVSVFFYGSESCRPSLFDVNTTNRLYFWLLDCDKRHQAAARQNGFKFCILI